MGEIWGRYGGDMARGRDRAEHLLRRRVGLGEGILRLSRERAHVVAEDLGGVHDARDRDEASEREAPRDVHLVRVRVRVRVRFKARFRVRR